MSKFEIKKADDGTITRYLDSLSATLSEERNVKLLKLALPDGHKKYGNYFLNVAYTAIFRNPNLMRCEINSMFRSILQAAQLNLAPNTKLGYAAIVPHWNNYIKHNEAQLYIQYQGHLELAYRSPRIISIEAAAVYESEYEDTSLFDYNLGTDPWIKHKLDFSIDRDKETPYLVYVVAFLRDRDKPVIKLYPRSEIFKRRAVSPSYRQYIKDLNGGNNNASCVWTEWELDMCLKTALLNARKFIPQSVEAAYAAEIEERMQANKPALVYREDMATVIKDDTINPSAAQETEAEETEKPTKSQRMAEELKKKNGDAAKKKTAKKKAAKKKAAKPASDTKPKITKDADKQKAARGMTSGQYKGLAPMLAYLEGKIFQDQEELAVEMTSAAGLKFTFSEAAGLATKYQSRIKKNEGSLEAFNKFAKNFYAKK